MSDAKAAPSADAAAPKSKKNILLFAIIGLIVVVLLVGGALAFFLLKTPAEGSADEAVAEANAHAEDAKKEKEKKKKEKEKKEGHTAPVFDKLQDQAFTVNLAGDTESVLQVEIMVELAEEHDKERLKGIQPKALDAVNRLLRSKTLEQVKTTEGQETLAREIREALNHLLEAEAKDEGVLSVNFTKYFYQVQ
ncbi:flagellar basal body-associated FliL family protein [Chitinibacter fontanus]|uniref:Flagellar protein FliL n=1 Tax=Chitinibacter fontanus TaxID=1737446 RepID=A0A7D5V873_9NEIS|nr:flagellar basal body-associated FliL family protein [Chitinibacter fontanus]QLI80717.1 flagellar basal body-associated FliL family protein [Chitinibacter fontanus]